MGLRPVQLAARALVLLAQHIPGRNDPARLGNRSHFVGVDPAAVVDHLENRGFPQTLNEVRPLIDGSYVTDIATDDAMEPGRLVAPISFFAGRVKSAKHRECGGGGEGCVCEGVYTYVVEDQKTRTG